MTLRLRVYVAVVAGAALVLLATHPPPGLEARWPHYLGWTAICLLSEMLWLATVSGQATVSMASTANLAALVLWGPEACMAMVSVSTLGAELFVQRKPWVRAVFNAAQSVLTVWVAGTAFVLLGGPPRGLEHQGAVVASGGAASLAAPILAMFAAYLLVNRALVAVAVAWSTERPYLRVLRQDWFYRERLLDDLAMFFLSPIVVLSYGVLGYVGVALFYAPLRITYESQKRYVELRRTQSHLIHQERMAAKGEMAAEIGHELRNQLATISGRAQLLERAGRNQGAGDIARHARIIIDQAQRMESLARGLMDFSSAELRVERVDLSALVQRSVEFVRAHQRFAGVEWRLAPGSPMPDIRCDPGQIQQVLFNLFLNAAEAMAGSGRSRHIAVATGWDERNLTARVVVTDNGPGIPPEHRGRIFEPQFTTKSEGHGFGLSTSYRIVANHGGHISCDSPAGGGAVFTVTLPAGGPGGWS